ncbi:pheromone processing endoprotease [Melampsora americana]|nr:pheromone processing endoprotease [Melampsora americana]
MISTFIKLNSFSFSISFIFIFIFIIQSNFNQISSTQQPKRRHYDTHEYYVIEIKEEAINLNPEEIIRPLEVEFVERVGELKDVYLVKAHKEIVNLGFDHPLLDQKHSSRSSSSSSSSIQIRSENEALRKRDRVIERFEFLKRSLNDPIISNEVRKMDLSSYEKRSIPEGLLSSRQAIRLMKSIEKQVLRKRHKRDVIYIPSHDGSKPIIQTDSTSPDLLSKREAIQSLSQRLGSQFNIQDPLWSKQWHLANDQIREHMINATDVWATGITGKNVTVAIVDDGLDMTSDDLSPNFFEAGSWDYNDHAPLPAPRLPDDLHGTRCAGEIAAIRNDVCGVGVAYDAKVAGIRILSASISDADEASALNYKFQENLIYSCSWGPPDDGKSMEAPSRLIFKAILNGIQNGRGGKGSVFVFASGNGGAVDDQCNFDGYTNSIYSVTISAVDRKGLHPYYSEVCSANMVVTYSSGSGDNIHTTDVGKNKCTDRHGGTSAAAPLGAGIFALVLEARPDLTWRDVQHLAVNTAKPILMSDPDWQKTATGRWYNHKFGFGNMDAPRIVEAAKTWKLVKPQAYWTSPNVNAQKQMITKDGVNSTLEVKQSDLDEANFETLEHITVALNVLHGRRGNVRVTLTSPHGTVSILATHRRYDEADTGFPGWVFMTVKHWGEPAVGNWTLSVLDLHQTPGKNGTFEDWAMGLWGECKDPKIQKLFKMPDDSEIHLPVGLPISGVPFVENEKTKLLSKPTAHLPEDHAGMLSGLSGMTLSGKSVWIFIVFGTMIIIGGSLLGWMMMRRMKRRRRLGIDGGGGDDDDEADNDEDDRMGLLTGGKRHQSSRKKVRMTKELYDAFGNGSESEGDETDEEEGEDQEERRVERKSEGKGKGKEKEEEEEEYRDD